MGSNGRPSLSSSPLQPQPHSARSQAQQTQADRCLEIGDEVSLISQGDGILFGDGLLKKRAFVLDNWRARVGCHGDLNKFVFKVEPVLAYKDMRVSFRRDLITAYVA
jgi:hypothetical protein